MCEYFNEPNGIHAFLVNRIKYLEDKVERLSLALIEATNPGINMEAVKQSRLRHEQ